VALQSSNGKYVTANPHDYIVHTVERHVKQWETFELVDLGNRQFALKSVAAEVFGGMYVGFDTRNKSLWLKPQPSAWSIGMW
jgi:hypothetical protein